MRDRRVGAARCLPPIQVSLPGFQAGPPIRPTTTPAWNRSRTSGTPSGSAWLIRAAGHRRSRPVCRTAAAHPSASKKPAAQASSVRSIPHVMKERHMHMHVGEWDDLPSHKVRTGADRLRPCHPRPATVVCAHPVPPHSCRGLRSRPLLASSAGRSRADRRSRRRDRASTGSAGHHRASSRDRSRDHPASRGSR